MAMFPGQQKLANASTMCRTANHTCGIGGAATFASYDDRAKDGEVLYGLDKELAEKAAAKYDPRAEHECRMWIEAVLNDQLGSGTLQEELKDGIVLCNLINAISPGLVKSPSRAKMPFKQMENISMYLDGCTALGVPKFSLFQTVALYENKDMFAVLTNIQALGSAAQKVPGYSGPILGAKVADAAPREFTAAQLTAGKTAQTFLGKGSHGQANAAGMIDRNKEINKMGFVSGAGAASNEPTFLGTGSHGGATQAGMGRHHEIVRGANAMEKVRRMSGGSSDELRRLSGSAPSGMMAGSTGLANQSNMCRTAPNSQGTGGNGQAVFARFEDHATADGNVNYGLDADLAAKAAAKYDPALEAECRNWIEQVVGEKMGESTLQEELKNGVVLCYLVNKISPGITIPPSTSKMPFKQMENISMYLEATQKLGVGQHDLFQTVALYENKDMLAVLTNIQSLGRCVQSKGWNGPQLGAKLATANVRNFTEEQLAAGLHTQTFLGAGSHGHANQSGMIDHSKEINKMGFVAGASAASNEPTFLGTGSRGGATQAGMGRHHEIIRQQGQ